MVPEGEGGTGSPHAHRSQLGLQTLVRYSWEISLGGLKLTLAEFEKLAKVTSGRVLEGKAAYELYATYGFPQDLVELLRGRP